MSFVQSAQLILSEINTLAPYFIPCVVLLYSAVVGSLITCAVHRVPKQLSMRTPASHCPCCNNKLGVKQLVPVFSYVFYRGRCAFCGAHIPIQYLMLELVTIAAGFVVWLMLGAQIALVPALFSAWGFVFVGACYALERYLSVKVLLFSIICLLLLCL